MYINTFKIQFEFEIKKEKKKQEFSAVESNNNSNGIAAFSNDWIRYCPTV